MILHQLAPTRFASSSEHRGKQHTARCRGFGGNAPHSNLPLAPVGSTVQNHNQGQSKLLPRQSTTNSMLWLPIGIMSIGLSTLSNARYHCILFRRNVSLTRSTPLKHLKKELTYKASQVHFQQQFFCAEITLSWAYLHHRYMWTRQIINVT